MVKMDTNEIKPVTELSDMSGTGSIKLYKYPKGYCPSFCKDGTCFENEEPCKHTDEAEKCDKYPK